MLVSITHEGQMRDPTRITPAGAAQDVILSIGELRVLILTKEWRTERLLPRRSATHVCNLK